ncbi:MAG TPA: hypothetical protein VGR62_07960 [Candidatus Binatia bacterium]|jgi:hypothetical protein|nr:hypothetical protein [Candidatus Binatia bacterium]
MRRAFGAFGLALFLTVSSMARAAVTVPWQQAPEHVGQQVTVEGDVAAARLEGPTCVIEFSTTDTKAFRVVLLVPLITDLPKQPERLYAGKRIRASGTVRRFAGRAEMILRTPDAIEVIDIARDTAVASAPPQTPTTTPSIAGATTTTTTTPSAHVTSPEPATTVPPSAPVVPVPPIWPLRDTCTAAKERWREAADAARERATALTRCLDGDSHRCRPVAAALAPALTTLEWAEQQVEAACP